MRREGILRRDTVENDDAIALVRRRRRWRTSCCWFTAIVAVTSAAVSLSGWLWRAGRYPAHKVVVGGPNGVAEEEAWATCSFALCSDGFPIDTTAELLPSLLLFRELPQHTGAA